MNILKNVFFNILIFRLKTGWSIKTGSMGYGVSTNRNNSNTGLDPEEQATILEVIQRAEQLELREQERVIILFFYF